MKAIAPGKLVLTGAYAVLDGAPAIVAAVDRYARADSSRPAVDISPEIREAFESESAPPPFVDVGELHDVRGRKLGLGSSAAGLVASLAAVAGARGEDVAASDVRNRIFRDARGAHARAQRGGSGVDVAASVYGGVLRYEVTSRGAVTRSVALPPGIVVVAFDTGVSARTSDLLARVTSARILRAQESTELANAMRIAAAAAADAVEAAEGDLFVALARHYGTLLARLGSLCDAPIVRPVVAELDALAERTRSAFLPSGAGGGDLVVWIGAVAPPAAFLRRAEALGLTLLPLSVDRGGVRPDLLSP